MHYFELCSFIVHKHKDDNFVIQINNCDNFTIFNLGLLYASQWYLMA